jgi:hypothetical protein
VGWAEMITITNPLTGKDVKVRLAKLNDGIAGRTKDSTYDKMTIIVDPIVPRWYYPFLAVHEAAELKFETEGHKYPGAHEMATKIEKEYVEKTGKNYEKYNDTYHKLLKQIENRSPKPKDPSDIYHGHTKGPAVQADLEAFTDEETLRLVKIYSKAEKDLLKSINRALLRGNDTKHLEALNTQVKAIRRGLLQDASDWVKTVIPEAYRLGAEDTGLDVIESFSLINQKAMKLLADNTYQRLEQVDQVIGRTVNDIYRSVALENTTGAIAGYETWKQAAKKIKEDLADRGVTGFVDRTGRQWDMSDYTEMVARTNIAQVQRTGAKNRLAEHGHRLAQITEGSSPHTCEACDEWAGQIVSINGEQIGDYPTLEDAEDAGCFHPNCVHRLVAAIDEEEALDEEDHES